MKEHIMDSDRYSCTVVDLGLFQTASDRVKFRLRNPEWFYTDFKSAI